MDQEFKKTLTVIVAAVVSLLFAFIVQPRRIMTDIDTSEIGKEFFSAFTDPMSATSLEVIGFDENEGKKVDFKVERGSLGWFIPSKNNYPADASSQMEQSAGALIGLEILSKESDNPADHTKFGLLDPSNASSSDVGVGTLVRMKDSKGNELAQLIVGEEVKDQAGLHYVRRPRQDRVYTAKIALSNLSTKFVDWVEKDFLDLNAFNVREILFDNHEIDEAQGRVVQGPITRLSYDSNNDPDWSLLVHQKGQEATNQLPAGSKLDETKLNDMRTALDDLEIVDVVRKPEMLVPGLREGKDVFSNKDNQLESLMKASELQQRGFFPVNTSAGIKLYSNEGQINVTMNDGVEYVLRFGEVAQDTESKEDKDKALPISQNDNRFLFVAAKVNQKMLDKPAIKPVPELPTLEAIKASLKAGDQPPAEDKLEEMAKAEFESRKAEIETIKKENTKTQEDFDIKLKDLNKRVDELNGKFAPWYYVIADDVYKKIKLKYEDILSVDEKSQAMMNKKKGEDFLKANAGKEGVKMTASGLQYKILTPAKDAKSPKPKASDTVKVKYRGTLIDGTEFDAGETSFGLGSVIKGWTEGLQLMPVGSKYQFFIPSDLAYGETGSGPKIGPNSALIFEVELLGIE